MRRLAFIGNSHIGAPRQGWERVRDRFPGVAIEFFAAPGHYFPLLELDSDLHLHLPQHIVAERGPTFDTFQRINGRMGIELASADVVVWVGYRWPWSALVATHDIDGLPAGGTGRMLSRPAFDAICGALAQEMLPPAAWRGWHAPRLVISMRPVRASSPKGRRARELSRSPERQTALAAARRLFLERLEAEFAACGIGLYRQPEETFTPLGTTRPEFSRGAVRMLSGRPFPDEDNSHMNPAFGAVWIEGLLGWLGATAASPPHRAA